MSVNVENVLLAFGLGSLTGLWFAGIFFDQRLASLATASVLIFALAIVLLALCGAVASTLYPTVIVWGLAVGGFATITQTALARFAGNAVDVAQAMYTTGWNTAVAVAGVMGGALLDGPGTVALPWFAIVILALAFMGVIGMTRALQRGM